MEEDFWLSAILGSGIGGIYILLSVISHRLALKKETQPFMLIVFGGMAIRLFVTVAAIALIFALVPVAKAVFLTAFLCIFLVGLVVEIWILHRQTNSLAEGNE